MNFHHKNVLFLDNNKELQKWALTLNDLFDLKTSFAFCTTFLLPEQNLFGKMSDEKAKKLEEKASDSEEAQSNEDGENAAKDVNNKKKKKKRRNKGNLSGKI